MLVAGEASGDALGASLMVALTQLSPDPIRFSGVGGELMAAAGLNSAFPMRELAVMGIAEVLPRLPSLLRRIDQTVDLAISGRPDALVTIDAPSFSLRVSRRLSGQGIPRVHYVAPQLWAWRPGRAKRLAERTDVLLALLPFEPEFFRGFGVDCRFVGHPAVERVSAVDVGRLEARQLFGLDAEQPVLALLPGSRHGEIKRLLPVYRSVCERLRAQRGDLAFVLPTVSNVAAEIRQAIAGWSIPVAVVEGLENRISAFRAADAALAASGTVTVELALAGTPMVVCYRANPLTAALVRRLLKVSYVAMPNILVNGPVVPEFIQENCRPDAVAEATGRLLDDSAERSRQREALARIAGDLGAGGEAPSLRAARAVLEVLQHRGVQTHGS